MSENNIDISANAMIQVLKVTNADLNERVLITQAMILDRDQTIAGLEAALAEHNKPAETFDVGTYAPNE